MRKFLFCFALLFLLTGCQSFGTKLVDGVDEQVRLKWAEEWKPALLAQMQGLSAEAKEAALKGAVIELEKYKAANNDRLTRIGVKVEEFDADKDGKVSGVETVALLKEIKAKNDQSKDPLEWWEILLAVAGAYVPLTGAKELARRKLGTEALKA